MKLSIIGVLITCFFMFTVACTEDSTTSRPPSNNNNFDPKSDSDSPDDDTDTGNDDESDNGDDDGDDTGNGSDESGEDEGNGDDDDGDDDDGENDNGDDDGDDDDGEDDGDDDDGDDDEKDDGSDEGDDDDDGDDDDSEGGDDSGGDDAETEEGGDDDDKEDDGEEEDDDDDNDEPSQVPTDTQEVKEEICDEDGNCYCLRLAVVGTSENSVDMDETSEFADWLNNDSSCHVTLHTTKPALDDAFFKELDIILFQHLADGPYEPYWDFSSTEIQKLKAWVEEGNGMITLTGFNGIREQEEVAAINSVLEPVSGMSYNTGSFVPGDGYDEAYCWGGPWPIQEWDETHDISQELEHIPGYYGYSINAPADAVVVATEGGENAAVALELGAGRVFAFADEWLLYNKLWNDGETNENASGEPDSYNPCWNAEKEEWNNAENFFQIPQFWYNVIKWVAPPNDCFVIEHPDIIVV